MVPNLGSACSELDRWLGSHHLMWKWIARLAWIVSNGGNAHTPVTDRKPPTASRRMGKYASFHDYLANRYADVVVLTFVQIEDLLGFALPDSARTRLEWWTTDAQEDEPRCSDAWVLAGRTARPNLLARTVAFERPAGVSLSR